MKLTLPTKKRARNSGSLKTWIRSKRFSIEHSPKNYEIEMVDNGADALERFSPGQYDADIIDLMLPGIRGDQVALPLRQQDSTVSMVLITGMELKEDDPRLQAFDLYLPKPFGLQPLLDIVLQALVLHELRTGQHGQETG